MSDSLEQGIRLTATRQRILDGALRALSRRGVRKVSIEDICHEASISRRTLYRHFASREEVLAELALHTYQNLEAKLERAIESRPALEDRVLVVTEILLNYPTSNEDALRLSTSEPEFVRDILTSSYPKYEALVRNALSPMFEGRPELRAAGLDAADLAALIVRLATQVILAPRLPPFPMAETLANYWRLINAAARIGR